MKNLSKHFIFHQILLTIVLVHVATVVLSQPKSKPVPKKNIEKTTDKLVVYQIMTRLFGNQKSTNKFYGSIGENGVGKFNDITDKALQEIWKFGVSHVWYTGVIEHATMEDYSAFGIQPDHPAVVKGRAGSPYAIKDYYDVNPCLAVDVKKRMSEFQALVNRTHKNGLKVLIDFVPNHVARQYKSDARPAGVKDFGETDDPNTIFKASNNFYYLPGKAFKVPDGVNPPVLGKGEYLENPAKATGNDVFGATPSINDWYETIKLNYGVNYLNNRSLHFNPIPDTWLKMRDILTYWTKKGVDGFRCDMAEMVPVEFWGWCIPEIKKVNPAVVFIAEIYNPQEYRNYINVGKFDYLYDKVGLYDALRRLMENKPEGNVADITRVWQQESGDFANHMLRFLENHDEQRIASNFFASNPWAALPAMVVSATLHTGPVMVYFGQEVGVAAQGAEGFQGDDGRTTIFDYWGVPEFQRWVNHGKFDGGQLTDIQKQLRNFYSNLLNFCQKNEAVHKGAFYDLQYANNNGQSAGYNDHKVYSYLRHTAKQRFLFVCNFEQDNNYNAKVKIPKEAFEAMALNPNGKYVFSDVSHTSKTVQMLASEVSTVGLSLEFSPLAVHIFEIIPTK